LDSTTKALITGYFQKAEKKLEVAERLRKFGDVEDAVSRAYYAVFHATQALLLTEGHRAESHKGLVTLFSLLFVKTGKFDRKYGKYLVNLKDDRETGDYEALSYIDEETADNSLREAKEFLQKSRKYLTRITPLE
jgi:uncharacterized protein (UPF0332 family)